VFTFRSNSNIVIAPARTGRDSNNKIAVIKIDHGNRGVFLKFIILGFILKMVVIKLMAPRIEEIPARCNEKIAKSTDGP